MENISAVALTLGAGLLGGYPLYRLKAPAGMMLGGMLAVSGLNAATGLAAFPGFLPLVGQIGAGACIGAALNADTLRSFRRLYKPILIMFGCYFFLSLGAGFFLHQFSDLDLVSALFATAPGGISDVALIVQSLGANLVAVTVFQFLRLGMIIIVTPLLASLLARRKKYGPPVPRARPPEAALKKKENPGLNRSFSTGATLAAATLGGLLGYVLKIPGGVLCCSMLASGAYGILTRGAYMPRQAKPVVMLACGIMIGARFHIEDIAQIANAIVPAAVILLTYLGANVAVGMLLYKRGILPLETAFLASSMGGITEMAMIAEDIGADAPTVVVMHLSRAVSVVAVYPWVISWLAGRLA